MPSTPYARLLLSLDGGDATAGASEATAEAAVQPVYESTAGWPATPPPYLEIFEYPLGWTPDPITGWVETGTAWRYYGATPPPAFAAPSLAQWGKVKMQLVVGGGRRAGVVSADMVSEAMVYVRSAEGLESVAYREATELDALRSWVGALQRDLRVISAALGAVGALTEAELRAVSATLTAALPVNGQKITGLANGTTSTDAAAFGQIASALASYVAATRAVNTTAPLSGGGALSADRTLTFAPSADVAMGGYGFTGCTGVANSAGDVTVTPKSDSNLVSRKDALTTTYASCVAARNATAATSLATVQNGPAVASEGSGWRTSAGGAAITVRGGFLTVPVSGSTVAARVYTVYDIGSGYAIGDYFSNSDPFLFGAARVVDTLIWTASGSGIRDSIDGNGGIRKNSTHIQLTSGSTNEVQLATNSTVRHAITNTGAVTCSKNTAAVTRVQHGTAGVNYVDSTGTAVTVTASGTGKLYTIATVSNSYVDVEVRGFAYHVGTVGNVRAFAVRCAFKNIAGTVTDGTQEDIRTPDNLGTVWGTPPAITLASSGTNILATGAAAGSTDTRFVLTSIEWFVGTTSA